MLRLPIFRALLAQLLALAVLAALVMVLARLEWRLPLWGFALAQGLGAALLGHRLGLSRWWLPLNALFAPALLLAQRFDIPAWLPLTGFVVLVLLNWNSARERVPLYLSGRSSRQALRELLATRPAGFTFIDLGCGLGSALCPLARVFPQARFIGVETAPLSFFIAWLRSLPLGNCQVRYRNLWQQPLDDADVVYCFLSPEPMPRLWRKAQAQMKAGSWLLSNSFTVPGVPPSRALALDDWRDSRLFCWEMPGPVAGDLAARDLAG